MKKVKKGQPIIKYDLTAINEITIQRIFEPNWWKIKLILRFNDGQEAELFKEDAHPLGTSWEKFAENLSRFIDKPLKKEKLNVALYSLNYTIYWCSNISFQSSYRNIYFNWMCSYINKYGLWYLYYF